MKQNPYQPDYAKLYLGVEISSETLKALKESDRKAEYMERDLKRNRYLRDGKGKIVKDGNGQPIELPERETSFEVLNEAEYPLPIESPSAEDEVFDTWFSEANELYRCLDLLGNEDRTLIDALFFSNDGKGMTEREYSNISGIPQKTVNDRKRKICAKLKKFMESES